MSDEDVLEEQGGLHGVTFDPKRGAFKSRIFFSGSEHFIGRYGTSLEAGLAYDQAARYINNQLEEVLAVGNSTGRKRMRPINLPDKIPNDPRVAKRLQAIFSRHGRGPKAHAGAAAANSSSKRPTPDWTAAAHNWDTLIDSSDVGFGLLEQGAAPVSSAAAAATVAAAAAAAPVSDVDCARLALHFSFSKRCKADDSTSATPQDSAAAANMGCSSTGDTACLADVLQVPASDWAVGQAGVAAAGAAELDTSGVQASSALEAGADEQRQEHVPSVMQHNPPSTAPESAAAAAAAINAPQQQQLPPLRVPDSSRASLTSLLQLTPRLQLHQGVIADPFMDCQEWDELLLYISGTEHPKCDTQPQCDSQLRCDTSARLPVGQEAEVVHHQQQQGGTVDGGLAPAEAPAAPAASTLQLPAVQEDHRPMEHANEALLQCPPALQLQWQQQQQQPHWAAAASSSSSLRPPQLLPMGACYKGSSSCVLPRPSDLQRPLPGSLVAAASMPAEALTGCSSAATASGLLAIGSADKGVFGSSGWAGLQQADRVSSVTSQAEVGGRPAGAAAWVTHSRTTTTASTVTAAPGASGLWACVEVPQHILTVSKSCLHHLTDLLLHLHEHQQQHDSCLIAAAGDWLRVAWQMEAINSGLLQNGAGPAAVCAATRAVKSSRRGPGASSVLALHVLDHAVSACAGKQASLWAFSNNQAALLFQVLVVLQQSMFELQQLVSAAAPGDVCSCRQLLQAYSSAVLTPSVSAANAAAVVMFNNLVSML